eukprot:6933099-Prymnesium_polylepis.1
MAPRLSSMGIKALSLRGQQHALVIVSDNHGPMMVQRFVDRLKSDKERIHAALGFDKAIFNEWCRSYVRYNHAAFIASNKWVHEDSPAPSASASSHANPDNV